MFKCRLPIQLEPRLFHADGWTDMTNLIAAFRNFANASKSECLVKKWLKASMGVDLFLVEVWAFPLAVFCLLVFGASALSGSGPPHSRGF